MKKEIIKDGLETIGRLRMPMLHWLKDVLDTYHNESNSLAYYDLIAGIWLEHFMHVVYAEWIKSRTKLLESYKEPTLELSTTPAEFYKLIVNSTDYHLNLRMAIYSIHNDINLSLCLQKKEDKLTNGVFISSPWNAKKIFKKILFRVISRSNAKVLICSPAFKCSPKDWILALYKLRHLARYDNLDDFISVRIKYDHSWRYSNSIHSGTSDDFLGVLKCLLPLCIPAVFLEGFKEYREKVLLLNKAQASIVYTATGLDTNLTFKFLVAEWKKNGTILLNHQHGGGYGMYDLHVLEDFEKRVSDYFYSWGWTSKNRKVLPLSVGIPNLRHAKRSKQILLNCNECHRNIYRLHFYPMPGTMKKVISNTIDFVLGLPEHKNLLIRPYHHDCGWNFLNKLKNVAPNAKYDTGYRRLISYKRFAESRIVVHNVHGTGCLESLALNIPTLCFFEADIYKFRKDARPYTKALEEVGILHRSGKEAALFLLGVWNEVEIWWQKPEVQEARKAFCEKYANFSPNWPQLWRTEFKRILSLNSK
jgi:putative transferase (TIGR04331 family)